MISATALIVPRLLETCGNATSFGSCASSSSQVVHVELPSSVSATCLEARALLLGQQLPGHQVGVVLHHRHDDQVAGLDVAPAPGLGDQVDRLGRVADEDASRAATRR